MRRHRRVVQGKPVAASRLSPIERGIGVPQQQVTFLPVDRIDADADACGHEQFLLVYAHRRPERVEELLRRSQRVLAAVQAGKDEDELVAAHAGHRVALAQDRPQPTAQLDQQPVAHAVTEAVVDRLDPVDVEERYGHQLSCPPGAPEHHVQPVLEEPPVGQPGELVVGSLEQDPLAVRFLQRDIAHGRDPSAPGPAQHADGNFHRKSLAIGADPDHLGPHTRK
jgi:hypothetical protein